jgi:hypothetical protein
LQNLQNLQTLQTQQSQQPLQQPAYRGTPTTGTGAVAAGKPTIAPTLGMKRPAFVSPAPSPTPAPKVNVPIAKAASQAAAAKREEVLKAQLQAEPKFGFVYLLKRILAYTIDSGINIGLAAASFSLALWNQNLQPDLLLNSGVILVAGLFFFVFSWAIMTAQEIAFGTTLGKRIFGLTLRGSATAIFLRSFFFLPSMGFLGVGLLWGLLDKKKRCWHDLIVNLQPVSISHEQKQ